MLARLHDTLLFFCAYPASPRVLKRAEALLKSFGKRVAALDDTDALDDPEVSGIAGTSVTVVFSYDFVRWLADRFPAQIEIDWEQETDPEKLAALLSLLVPFLEEEASVDVNVPFERWLKAAGAMGKDGGLSWLIAQIERLPLPPQQRAILYDSLNLWIRWRLGNSAVTRTAMRRRPRAIFFQESPLLARRDVSITRELAGKPLRITRLTRRDGEAVLDMARAALATRYRELHCFNYGDPATVLSADCGRGLEILLVGIAAEKRLPLRAGFAPLILRNGVPIGYGDAFGICERMEVSLNIFYAFRDGESAYCLAMMLKLYHQLFGSTSFSIDPYQIGMENDEAIESGAFWFYRKLGFRCTDARIERMARREEERVASEPAYRTSARTLKQLARGSMVWDARPAGEWDRFHVRNIGLAVQKTLARSGGVAAALGIKERSLNAAERRAFERLAPVLAAIRDLDRWSAEERAEVREIIRAKAGRREEVYLKRLGRHERLRRALIHLGSSST